jgi:hypothetical protein
MCYIKYKDLDMLLLFDKFHIMYKTYKNICDLRRYAI